MITIKTPFVDCSEDYHDLFNTQRKLSRLSGKEILIQEFTPNNGTGFAYSYGAVFYLKGEEELVLGLSFSC